MGAISLQHVQRLIVAPGKVWRYDGRALTMLPSPPAGGRAQLLPAEPDLVVGAIPLHHVQRVGVAPGKVWRYFGRPLPILLIPPAGGPAQLPADSGIRP